MEHFETDFDKKTRQRQREHFPCIVLSRLPIYPSTLASCGHCSSSGIRSSQTSYQKRPNLPAPPRPFSKGGGKHFRCTQSVTPKKFSCVFFQQPPNPNSNPEPPNLRAPASGSASAFASQQLTRRSSTDGKWVKAKPRQPPTLHPPPTGQQQQHHSSPPKKH